MQGERDEGGKNEPRLQIERSNMTIWLRVRRLLLARPSVGANDRSGLTSAECDGVNG